MSPLALAAAYLRQHPLSTLLNVLLVALGVATLAVLLLLSRQAEQALAAGAGGVDFVVGAEGSPLQLILSAVYHVDSPTGNIPGATLETLRRNRAVAQAVPLALGDSYRGVRIVGTDTSAWTVTGARLAAGRLWQRPGEVVVGARAAHAAGLSLGDTLVGAHGLSEATAAYGHDDAPLIVVGRLAPGAGTADGLIWTSVETVWQAHGLSAGQSGAPPPPPPGALVPPPPTGALPPPPGMVAPSDGRDLTAILVRVASPIAVALLPRQIDAEPGVQAAVPAREVQRLLRLFGVGFATLRLFGVVLLGAALLSLFLALTTAMRARRADLAVLRALGARRRTLVALVLAEGLALTTAGLVAGLALGHAAVEVLGRLAPGAGTTVTLTGWTWVPAESALVAAALVVGLVASALPALTAYRTSVATTLAEA